jgi:hypothetical protein
VVASKVGFDRDISANVDVEASIAGTADFQLRRDWAAFDGGARIIGFTGPNFGPLGCGPSQAIDQSLGSGWSTARPNLPPTGARWISVKLPSFVDVSSFAVDPGAVCGDPDAASTQGYKIETSKTGAAGSWAVVKTGSFTLGQAHQLNPVAITPRNAVRYVRFTITSNHGDPQWMDLAELVVYGLARPACLGKPATRVGTEGADVINGGPGADVVVALGGNDRIDGKGGKDVLCAGAGNDRLTGGPARDEFDGGEGNDVIYSRDRVKETVVRGGSGTDKARRDQTDKTTGVERRF